MNTKFFFSILMVASSICGMSEESHTECLTQDNQPENEMFLLPEHSFIRKVCTTNPRVKGNRGTDGVAFHCARMQQMLWCAKNVATKPEVELAAQRIKDGNPLEGDFAKVSSSSQCNSHDHDWKRSAGDTPFWNANYHSSKLCEDLYAEPELISAEMALFLQTLHKLESQKPEYKEKGVFSNIADAGNRVSEVIHDLFNK